MYYTQTIGDTPLVQINYCYISCASFAIWPDPRLLLVTGVPCDTNCFFSNQQNSVVRVTLYFHINISYSNMQSSNMMDVMDVMNMGQSITQSTYNRLVKKVKTWLMSCRHESFKRNMKLRSDMMTHDFYGRVFYRYLIMGTFMRRWYTDKVIILSSGLMDVVLCGKHPSSFNASKLYYLICHVMGHKIFNKSFKHTQDFFKYLSSCNLL